MFKIDVPHPIGNRTFDTREDAARVGRAFGVDVRQIVTVKEEPMEEYVCHYALGRDHRVARAVYRAPDLAQAMATHNAMLPQFADKVLKWVGPTGITFLFHDSKLTPREK